MTRACLLLGWLGLGVWAGAVPCEGHAQPADTRRIRVRVVEVAGGRAYLRPGEASGLYRGDRVRLGKRGYTVVAAGRDHALVDLGGGAVRVGQVGSARVASRPTEEAQERLAPEPLAAFQGEWPEATVPAATQTPTPVPLGQPATREHGSTQLSMFVGGAALVPFGARGEPMGRGLVRARLKTQPVETLPLVFEADLATQAWFAPDLAQRAGGDSRPVAQVYALSAAYGDSSAYFGVAGRLRYAAASLGTLDGGRVQAPLGAGVRVAAFGGLVPDPLDGRPDFDSSRFGGELIYESLESAWRPRVSVTGYGSRYAGASDERRVQAQADFYPEHGYGGGYAQLSFFGANNPWDAPATQVTAAGAHGGVRYGKLRAGGRFDLQRPERSRRLDHYLPREWTCVPQPQAPGTGVEPCYGDEARYLGQADFGVDLRRSSLDVGATLSRTRHVAADQQGGFLHVRALQLFPHTRADFTLSGSYGDVFRTLALHVAPGFAFGRKVDLTLRYRPALGRYRADLGFFVEHTVGSTLRVCPRADLDLSLDAEVIHGRDVDLFFTQVLAGWHL